MDCQKNHMPFITGIVVVIAMTSATITPAWSQGATALAQEAASMAPGEFRVMTANTDNTVSDFGDLMQSSGAASILGWSNKGLWDPTRNQVDYFGSGHSGGTHHVQYDEATDTWSQLFYVPHPGNGSIPFGHGYDHNAMNPANGDMYFRPYNSLTITKHDKSLETTPYVYNQQWIDLPTASDLPDSAAKTVAAAIEYFPEMGGLIYIDGHSRAGVRFFNEATDTWSELAPGEDVPMGPYHNVAKYSPIHKVVMFGGGNGSTDLYTVDETGLVSTINGVIDPNDLTQNVGVHSADARLTIDPVSGDFLAFATNDKIYQYDMDNDQWNHVGTHPLYDYTSSWYIAISIDTHDIIMFLTWNYDNSKVILYKHAAPSGPTLSLSASPTSIDLGQTAELTWNGGNATACTASDAWSGNKPITGSESIAPTETGIYTLACSNADGTTTRSVTVTVNQPIPVVSLTANPASIDQGNSSTLTWTVSDADSCAASDDWSGSKSTSGGSETVTPDSTSTYTLTCSNSFGSADDNATVAVNLPPGAYELIASSEADGHTNGMSLDGMTLNGSQWIYVLPEEGISGVSFYLDDPTLSGTPIQRESQAPFDFAGSASAYDTTSIADGAHTAHALVTLSAGGQTTLNATFTVNNGGGADPLPVITSFTANPSTITSGDDTTLMWNSTDADSCTGTLGWTGTKTTSGSEVISGLMANSLFTLTCTNTMGSDSETIGVTVNTPPPTDDTDQDGLLDSWEQTHFGNLGQGPNDDSDSDGVNNLNEMINGTDPMDSDSDNDGLTDGDEITHNTDPLDPDSDDDGYTDSIEVDAGSNPNDASDNPTSLPPEEEEDSGGGALGLLMLILLSLLWLVEHKRWHRLRHVVKVRRSYRKTQSHTITQW